MEEVGGMIKIIYDGEGCVFGRLASVVAKDLLKGDFVDVINCERVVISGDKKLFVEKILAKRRMGSGGSLKGPKYIRQSDRLVKRMIRGMLPWDRARGRGAFKRLRCYVGDGGLKDEDLKNIVKLSHKKPMKYFAIKEAMELLK
ncbi:MAG: 50S ribosomal protein L13 [archaeon]